MVAIQTIDEAERRAETVATPATLQQLAERKMDAQLSFSAVLRDLEQKHREMADADYHWSAACLATSQIARETGAIRRLR